jgi:hypothetical protein
MGTGEFPFNDTELGAAVQLDELGAPLQVTATAPLNPPNGLTSKL